MCIETPKYELLNGNRKRKTDMSLNATAQIALEHRSQARHKLGEFQVGDVLVGEKRRETAKDGKNLVLEFIPPRRAAHRGKQITFR